MKRWLTNAVTPAVTPVASLANTANSMFALFNSDLRQPTQKKTKIKNAIHQEKKESAIHEEKKEDATIQTKADTAAEKTAIKANLMIPVFKIGISSLFASYFFSIHNLNNI